MTHTTPLSRLLVLVLVIILSACSAPTAAAPTSTTAADTAAPAEPTATVEPPTATPVPPTATEEPTATPVPPTETPTPQPTFGPAEDGLAAYCLPEDTVLAAVTDITAPPDYARHAEMVEGALEVTNLPAIACAFLYTFNDAVPEGLTLEVYEQKGTTPWLTAALEPVEGSPNTAAAMLRHTYIVAPPLWNVSFQFAVKDGQGQEIRRDLVNLRRWTPGLCFNGQPPNPITLRCPLWQDLHPWDAGYGTVLPTLTPGPEE